MIVLWLRGNREFGALVNGFAIADDAITSQDMRTTLARYPSDRRWYAGACRCLSATFG